MKYLNNYKVFENASYDKTYKIIEEIATDCFVENEDFEIDSRVGLITKLHICKRTTNDSIEEYHFFYEDLMDNMIKFLQVINEVKEVDSVDFFYYSTSLIINMKPSELISEMLPIDKSPVVSRTRLKPNERNYINIDNYLRLISINFKK